MATKLDAFHFFCIEIIGSVAFMNLDRLGTLVSLCRRLSCHLINMMMGKRSNAIIQCQIVPDFYLIFNAHKILRLCQSNFQPVWIGKVWFFIRSIEFPFKQLISLFCSHYKKKKMERKKASFKFVVISF